MDLLTYVRALRRRWLIVVACVVVCAAVGYATTLMHSETAAKKGRTYYTATNIVVIDYGSQQSGLSPAYSNLDQIALVLTDGDVAQRVADKLKTPETGRELAEHVVTTANPTTSTLEITVADPDRDRAVQLADTFASALDDSLVAADQQRYDTYITNLKARIADLQQQANDLLSKIRAVPPPPDIDTVQEQYDATRSQYNTRYSQLLSAQAGGAATTTVTVLQKAEADPIGAAEYAARLNLGATGQNHLSTSTSDDASAAALAPGTSSTSFNSPIGRAFAGGFLGLLIGIGIVLALERFDRRLRTRQEVEQAFQLPVLAEVPRMGRKDAGEEELIAFSAPLSRVAEAFRAVQTSLLFQQSMAT
ncbi:MAG TPA: hypothetical protein VHS03_15485, partial [Gaiellaceae bacterium]|nr:hypothetical protein [Gaiellaceae bacterium]